MSWRNIQIGSYVLEGENRENVFIFIDKFIVSFFSGFDVKVDITVISHVVTATIETRDFAGRINYIQSSQSVNAYFS